MQKARLQTQSTSFYRRVTPAATTGEHPHQIWAVNDAATGQVALAEEAAGFGGGGLGVDGELKGGWKKVAPFFELVVEFGYDVGEALQSKRGCAGAG